MKTISSASKSKQESKPVSKSGKVGNKKFESKINQVPDEEEIREKANELYLQRTERGEFGTAEHDWIEAEKLLKNPN
jgi:predicted PilT family ATPase